MIGAHYYHRWKRYPLRPSVPYRTCDVGVDLASGPRLVRRYSITYNFEGRPVAWRTWENPAGMGVDLWELLADRALASAPAALRGIERSAPLAGVEPLMESIWAEAVASGLDRLCEPLETYGLSVRPDSMRPWHRRQLHREMRRVERELNSRAEYWL